LALSRAEIAIEDGVLVLGDNNFEEATAAHSQMLVEFYAPWCGHCKRLEPEYEKVAKAFEGDAEVVIAKLDADAHRDLGSQYGVSGFPTLKWFPKNDKSGQEYNAGRTPEEFVAFVNEQTGSERTLAGGVTDKAGRIDQLDDIATRSQAEGADTQALLTEAENLIATALTDHKNLDFSRFYLLTLRKLAAGVRDYAEQEYLRLNRMLSSGNISSKDFVQFSKRKNIIQQFLNIEQQ